MVRELRGVICAMARSSDRPREELRFSLRESAGRAAAEAERQAIRLALQATRGNKSEAARLLRVDYKTRSEEHTSEPQSPCNLVCRLLLEKKKNCTPAAYNHYAVGLAHAMNTPYQWTQPVAAHRRGARHGTIAEWPIGIGARGECTSPFHD